MRISDKTANKCQFLGGLYYVYLPAVFSITNNLKFKQFAMAHLTDIEIAQAKDLQHIKHIATKLNIKEDDLEMYGKYKAKLPLEFN